MRKIGHIALVVFMIGVLYLLMMIFQPAINSMVETANSTVNSTAHDSFKYAQAALLGWPFWCYLIPVAIGMILVVAILKGE